jgi:hypothetical protein
MLRRMCDEFSPWKPVQRGSGRKACFRSVPRTKTLTLRVRPGSLRRITELSQHEADGRKAQKHEGAEVAVFPILGQSSAAVQPRNCPFNNPTLGQFHEPLDLIGSLDDLDFKTRHYFAKRISENRSLIGAIGEQLLEKRKPAKQHRQQRDAAVAILNAGGVNDGQQQQALCVYENMALLALDLLSSPKDCPHRIHADQSRPPS